MEISEIAKFARKFSVMVRIKGPDPKGLKMRNHAFHLHQSGSTTLSASGLLLPSASLTDLFQILGQIAGIHHHAGSVVITMASVIEPFLTAQHRDNPTKEMFPKLIPDAHIDVLVEGIKDGRNCNEHAIPPRWVPARLLALVDVSESSDALMSLIGAHGSSYEPASWEISWSLSPLNNDTRTGHSSSCRQVENDLRFPDESYRKLSLDESNNGPDMAKAATRIAILGVSESYQKDVLDIGTLRPRKSGDFLLVVGSPFGVLSPLHFYNSIAVGTIANLFPPCSSHSSLLMADIRGLPGMEGGPVFDHLGFLIGILTRPLRQKGSIAEIQLVISWDAITSAISKGLQKDAQRPQSELIGGRINIDGIKKASSYRSKESSPDVCLSQSPLEKATFSIALVTVGGGTWASGIVLNDQGLILTNAHVLEPWRYGRAPLLGLLNKSSSSSFEPERYISQQGENVDKEESRIVLPSQLGSSELFVTGGPEASMLDSNVRSYKRISVRLNNREQQIWYGAKVVYVSKGPWDVALLQIESIPDQLYPVTPEFSCPDIGATIHVIGHGLLGPRSDISPSVSSGVLANVVRLPQSSHLHDSNKAITEENNVPVMLQTTAAVHAGASGGAVVNSDGHLIGLVTSNARHGGGTIIPQLNFSIPCAALEPIFKFSGKQDLSILEAFNYPNERVSSIWALMPPPSTRLQAPEKNDREIKGSRFSQFLAEQRKDSKHLVAGRFPSKM